MKSEKKRGKQTKKMAEFLLPEKLPKELPKKMAEKKPPSKVLEVKRADNSEIPPELTEPEQGKGPRVSY